MESYEKSTATNPEVPKVNFVRPEQFIPTSPYRVFLAMHPINPGDETPEQQEFHIKMTEEFNEKLLTNRETFNRLVPLHRKYVNGENLTPEEEQELTELVASLG